MAKNEAQLRGYNATVAQTLAALTKVAEDRFWEIRAQDLVAGGVLINTGGSMWSWDGQNLVVEVKPTPTGCTVSVVGSLSRPKDEPDYDFAADLANVLQGRTQSGPGMQLVSWGEKGRVIKKLFAGLDEQLGAGTS